MDTLCVAAVPVCSTPDVHRNMAYAEQVARNAATFGANWVVLPEVVPYLGPDTDLLAAAEPEDGMRNHRMAALARELRVHIFSGMIESASDTHVYNTLYGFSPQGKIIAKYRKRHLFQLSGSHDETAHYLPGSENVVIECDGWRVGLGICFDLRFPEFFRSLAAAQPLDAILLPSAFTYLTGQDHWEILLRARAIENQCYVIAPNQVGTHWGDRRSWGYSMIVGPWGDVRGWSNQVKEIAMAKISRKDVMAVRGKIPMVRRE
jgi:nitrilase